MASDGGGHLDPVSALVLMILLSILGYAAYDSVYKFLQDQAPETTQQPSSGAPVLQPQQ